MEKTDQNGDIEGETPAQALEVAEEAAELSLKVNGEVKEVKEVPETTSGAVEKDLPGNQQELDDLQSDEDLSQQEISRTSDLEEEVSDEDKEDYQVNGKVSDEESDQKTEDLVSEKQNLEVHEGKQEIGEVIEVVEEIEIVEETAQSTQKPEEEKGVTEREVQEPEEEEIVEKKKIKYVEEDIDDLDFSDEPDSLQEQETEGSVAEFIEDPDADVIVEESEEEEEEEQQTVVQERLQSQQDLVDGEQKTKEPVQSVKTEEVIPTKDLRETKEPTKEKEKDTQRNTDRLTVQGVQRRRSSGESFQKLKDRFSDTTKVEENNIRNAEGAQKNNKENENERARGASNMSDAKKRFGGTSEKCTQCNRTVYPMEKMEVAGRLLHKTCFKCCKCNSQLSVGRFSIGGKDMYCMTHYKQAFREKGTYDVFTPDNPIKGKWENKAHE